MKRHPLFIGGDIYRRPSFGPRHPLAIPRVSTVIDLARALGWLPDSVYVDSPRATPDQLARFHDPDYIAAVMVAEARQHVTAETRAHYNLDTIEAPVYGDMFRRPATACGASIRAAELVRHGGVVYSPASGTHHGRPDRASGFCFFNDPVLGLLRLLDLGVERIMYVDIDAHHGDGVQDAFAHDARVLTVSVHESGRWPRTGAADDRAGGFARNIPVPPGFNDDEMAYVLDRAILPLAEAYGPEAIMIQAGADALADDPLAGLALSNRAHWAVVRALRDITPRLIVTGGGGYNPWSVARCWTGVWGVLNDFEIPARLPPAGEAVLRALRWRRAVGRDPPGHWFTTLADTARGGPVRAEVRVAARGAARPPLEAW